MGCLLACLPSCQMWQAMTPLHACMRHLSELALQHTRWHPGWRRVCPHPQVYESCMMLSTGGELLCFCDRRKLQWWVDGVVWTWW
jgi:hypothetical protein